MSKEQYAERCKRQAEQYPPQVLAEPLTAKVYEAIVGLCNNPQGFAISPVQIREYLGTTSTQVSRAVRVLIDANKIEGFSAGKSRQLRAVVSNVKWKPKEIMRPKIEPRIYLRRRNRYQQKPVEDIADEEKVRKCLTCLEDFISEWRGNRRCTRCKAKD